MPRRSLSPLARIVWLSALGAVVLLLVRGAHAGEAEIQKAKGQHQGRFDALIKGEQQPGPDDQAVAETFARYYVYLTANTRLLNPKGRLKQLADELNRQIKDNAIPHHPRNAEFMKQWTERVIVSFAEAMKKLSDEKDNRVGLVRLAMLLPIYAQTKQEKFGDFLGSVLADDKQHEVLKLYAVKALREYLPARPSRTSDPEDMTDPDAKKIHETIARDRRRVKAALEFFGRKWDTLEVPVAQYVRREALRTLAEAQVPAMKVRDGKAELPVALALLRTLSGGKDGLSPPPSLTEKCEAAIGVCKLKAKLIEDYQPEAGIYLLGRFLSEFIVEYTKDYPRFGPKKEKGAAKVIPALPWKMEAGRLQAALKELDVNLRAGTPTHAKALQLKAAAEIYLGKIARHEQGDQPTILQQFVEKIRPDNGRLFKGVKGIEVDLSVQAAE